MRIYDNRNSFYQWDTGQKVVHNFKVGDEVQFFNPMQRLALSVKAYQLGDDIVADVPNILLQNSYPIDVYCVNADNNCQYTKEKFSFKVVPRPKPSGYTYTETEIFSYKYLDERITELEKSTSCVSSWDDLIDKPFGEIVEYGDTLTVDKSVLEGNIVTDTSGDFVKVSDAAPTIDDFVNGLTISVPNETPIQIPYEELLEIYNGFGIIGMDFFFVIPSDNFVLDMGDDGALTFPEKGVYVGTFLLNMYETITFTIPNHNGFESIVVKSIDEKYLPAWDDLKNKPFGEIKQTLGDTLTWDGDIDSFTGVKSTTATLGTVTMQYVKMSDYVPTDTDIGTNSIVGYIVEGSYAENTVTTDKKSDGSIWLRGSGLPFVVIIPTDNLSTTDYVFPEKGVYFLHLLNNGVATGYCKKFTISNYNFDTTIIKKIDEKYLPESKGGAYIIELSGSSFNTVYQLTDEQKEQMNNNFANVLVHLTVDGILYVLTPLAFTDYPNYAITSIDGSKLASCITASLLPNYGLWVGKTDVDLANVGGGLSIKKIEFTDYDSLVAFVSANTAKIDKIVFDSQIGLLTFPVISTNDLTEGAIMASTFNTHINGNGEMLTYFETLFIPAATATNGAIKYTTVVLNGRTDSSVDWSKVGVTEVPANYFSEYINSVTIYYID